MYQMVDGFNKFMMEFMNKVEAFVFMKEFMYVIHKK